MCSSDLFPSHDIHGYGSFLSKTAAGLGHVTSAYFGHEIANATDNPLVYSSSQRVNILPILTYQKIYYDAFSHSQWEKHLAYAYNVDYWPGNTSIVPTKDMLKIRYANYPKDYFMGVLPNSQYGSVAVLPVLDNSIAPSQIGLYPSYRDWETDRKSTRLNSSHITRSRMPSSA